jgi:hypothetical protein
VYIAPFEQLVFFMTKILWKQEIAGVGNDDFSTCTNGD